MFDIFSLVFVNLKARGNSSYTLTVHAGSSVKTKRCYITFFASPSIMLVSSGAAALPPTAFPRWLHALAWEAKGTKPRSWHLRREFY